MASTNYRLLRLPSVCEITGLSRSRLYALIKENAFPAPLSLGKRAVAWESSEVQAWVEARVKAPRKLGGSLAADS